jgi:hypothetical protein
VIRSLSGCGRRAAPPVAAHPRPGGLVVMDRLVQAITVAQVSADLADEWEQAAAALVEAAIRADTALPAAWPMCARPLPHTRAVLDLTSDGMWRIADYLGSSGSYRRHLRGRALTGAEEAAALAELAEVAHGRVDLLAEEAGLAIGFHEQDTDTSAYLQIAQLCIEAGANTALVSRRGGTLARGRPEAAPVHRIGVIRDPESAERFVPN